MAARMELVAGRLDELLLVLGTVSSDAYGDRTRTDAYLSLGGGMDPTWLDLFAEAARSVGDTAGPVDFLEARFELDGPGAAAVGHDLTIERVDAGWVTAVARIPDRDLDRVAGGWIDRLEEELGPLPREEKPWIRELAGQVIGFCRMADRAPDVLFVWSMG